MRKLCCTAECCRETRNFVVSHPRRAATVCEEDLRGRQAPPAHGHSISRSQVKSLMTSQPACLSSAVLHNDGRVRPFGLGRVELLVHGKADGPVVVHFQHVALWCDVVERMLVCLAAVENLLLWHLAPVSAILSRVVLFRAAHTGQLRGSLPLAGQAAAVLVMGADWVVEVTAGWEAPGYHTSKRQWLQVVWIVGHLDLQD